MKSSLKMNVSRPVSWCIGGFKLSADSGQSEDVKDESQLCRGALVRSTSFQALHSALARLYRLDDFSLERIGQGFFSEVFKARHRVTGDIMVLKMNKLMSNRHNMLREVELMNRLHHQNILSYFGVCVDEGQLHALTEYINGGSLDSLIEDNSVELTWPTRVSLSFDISKGMDYLHCKNVFHRDLTSKNVLIKKGSGFNGLTAVIADFGLATAIPKDRCVRLRQVGSPYWMAPEVIRGDWYDHRVDAFSFGIIVCEIIARCEADPDILPRTDNFGIHYLAFSHMCQDDCPPSFLETAFQCCQIDPDSRPSFYELSKKLEKLLNYLVAAAEHRARKQKACHRRSFSDESTKLLKGIVIENSGNTRNNAEVIAASPLEVLERISAADPYFQPSTATVNPFNRVKLPAKFQLIMEDGGRFCHSMPDLRRLRLCQAPVPVSLCTLASSDMCLNQTNSSSCHCVEVLSDTPDSVIKKKSSCASPKVKASNKCVKTSVVLRDTSQRLACKDTESNGSSPRDPGGAVSLPYASYMRRRGSGESGFFSVEDVERMSTPELCLSYSELSTTSVVSNEDDEICFTSQLLANRSSSVVTDSSEDLSSLGCVHDWELVSQPDDDRSLWNGEYPRDIKSIVEFFERGYGSMRSSEDARRTVACSHRKDRLVPLLRSKFSPSVANRSLMGSHASSIQSKLNAGFAQVNSSKSFYTKDKWAAIRPGVLSPASTQPERKEGFRMKDRPKLYITEGTVRAKRTIFESK